jgi:hypothetical protein
MRQLQKTEGLELNRTHEPIVCANYVNLLLVGSWCRSKQKTKYVFTSRHQSAGQNDYIRVSNKSPENLAKFKYLGMNCGK